MITIDSKKVTKMMREYFAGKGTASEIAERHGMPVHRVYEYAKKLEKLGVSRKFVKKMPAGSSWNTIAKRVSNYVDKKSNVHRPGRTKH